jgi:hypothetical protein
MDAVVSRLHERDPIRQKQYLNRDAQPDIGRTYE